ncbi:hypothetical protein [Rhodococcus sovatensis]|uniref:Uncharacterized protein n=1 Tax=Rhodococcus sovatensis TaxID=1805840 RepID=A0ABZ2PHU4_9NOCA
MDTQEVPGSVVAGRFRLFTRRPSAPWVQQWDARELHTGREMTLTLVHDDVIRSRDPSADAARRLRGAVRATARGDVRIFDVAPYIVVVGEPGSEPELFDPVQAGETSTTPKSRSVVAFVAASAVLVAALGIGGWMLTTRMFGGDYGDVRNVVAVPSLPTADTSPTPSTEPILPAGVQVWSAVRAPDNAGDAALAVDADPVTSWSTDLYRELFGDPGNGIGVVVSFAQPTDLGAVWISTPNPGALVEIRTPPAENGALASTRVLGSGALNIGRTDIVVDAPAGLTGVLVWVGELAPVGTQFGAEFAEIGFTRK